MRSPLIVWYVWFVFLRGWHVIQALFCSYFACFDLSMAQISKTTNYSLSLTVSYVCYWLPLKLRVLNCFIYAHAFLMMYICSFIVTHCPFTPSLVKSPGLLYCHILLVFHLLCIIHIHHYLHWCFFAGTRSCTIPKAMFVSREVSHALVFTLSKFGLSEHVIRFGVCLCFS